MDNIEKQQISLSENPFGAENHLSQQAVNRIEVLTVLSQTILRELDAFRAIGRVNDSDTIDLAAAVRNYEADLIRCALLKTGGRQRQAARLLNMKVTTLNVKIKKYKIDPLGMSSQSNSRFN